MELAVDGVSADIERLGDIAHIPAMLLEHLNQRLPFAGLDRVEFDRNRRIVDTSPRLIEPKRQLLA